METSLHEEVLRAAAEAAGGTVVPAALADQAGAVRELVTAFKRSPSMESRAADLRPMGWLPLLVAAVLLLGQTALRRGASLLRARRAAVDAAEPRTPSGPRKANARLSSGNPGGAAGAFLKEAREGTAARHRLLQRRHGGAPRGRPQGGAAGAARGRTVHRPGAALPRPVQSRRRGPPRRPRRFRAPRHAARRGGRPPAGGAAPRARLGAGQVESRARRADAPAAPAVERRARSRRRPPGSSRSRRSNRSRRTAGSRANRPSRS